MTEANGLRDMFSMQLCTPKEATKFSRMLIQIGGQEIEVLHHMLPDAHLPTKQVKLTQMHKRQNVSEVVKIWKCSPAECPTLQRVPLCEYVYTTLRMQEPVIKSHRKCAPVGGFFSRPSSGRRRD